MLLYYNNIPLVRITKQTMLKLSNDPVFEAKGGKWQHAVFLAKKVSFFQTLKSSRNMFFLSRYGLNSSTDLTGTVQNVFCLTFCTVYCILFASTLWHYFLILWQKTIPFNTKGAMYRVSVYYYAQILECSQLLSRSFICG